MTSLFESERERVSKLQSTVHDLTQQYSDATERLTLHANAEKTLTDKTRDLVSIYGSRWFSSNRIRYRNATFTTLMPPQANYAASASNISEGFAS